MEVLGNVFRYGIHFMKNVSQSIVDQCFPFKKNHLPPQTQLSRFVVWKKNSIILSIRRAPWNHCKTWFLQLWFQGAYSCLVCLFSKIPCKTTVRHCAWHSLRFLTTGGGTVTCFCLFIHVRRVLRRRKRSEWRRDRKNVRRGFFTACLGDFKVYGTRFFVVCRRIFRPFRMTFLAR